MIKIDLEKAFDEFLDRREYDEAGYALFSIIRTAFIAGWKAANANHPDTQKVIKLYNNCNKNIEKTIHTDIK